MLVLDPRQLQRPKAPRERRFLFSFVIVIVIFFFFDEQTRARALVVPRGGFVFRSGASLGALGVGELELRFERLHLRLRHVRARVRLGGDRDRGGNL